MRRLKGTVAHLIATLGGIGHARVMPGTVGSVLAVPLVLLFQSRLPAGVLGRAGVLSLVFILLWILGLWAVHTATEEPHRDRRWVVIDEFLGMYVSLIPLAFRPAHPFFALVALLLFRLLDIRKPFGIRSLERSGTAFSVLSDDLAAGFLTAVLFWLFLAADGFTRLRG